MMSRRRLLACLVPPAVLAASARDAADAAAPRSLIVDPDILRAAGARFDGRNDDGQAVQAMLDQAAQHVEPGTAVVVSLPPGPIRFGAPIRSGAVDLMLRGEGRDATMLLVSGQGALRHGSAAEPARGTLEVAELAIRCDPGSDQQTTALDIFFAADVADECLVTRDLRLENWSQGLHVTNATRGWRCQNVEIKGRDNKMQPDAGIMVRSDASARRGCFDYLFTNVMISNYRWGWRFSIGAPLEGQVFRNCHAYNGHGLLFAECRLAGYRSLLWTLSDCDAEGAGPLVDLIGCRDITIRGGFYIVSNQPAVPAETDATRALLRLRNCVDVTTDHVEFDATPTAPDGLSVVFCDGDCRRIRFRDTVITALRQFRAGFQWARNPVANTIAELDTVWSGWAGGPVLLDESSNQVAQSTVRAAKAGDASADGFYTLHGRATLIPAADGTIRITLPARADGTPLFLDGPPTVNMSVEETGDARVVLRHTERDGFVLQVLGHLREPVTIHWQASGR